MIADASPVTDWLLPRLHAAVPIHLIIRPEWDDAAAPRPTNRRTSLATRLHRRARALWYRRADTRHADALDHALAPHGPIRRLDAPVHSVPSRRINDEATRALLASHTPDLVLVCGAPILTPAMCAIGSRGTWNVHLGFAPHWRGLHTLRVPWQRGDWAHLGVTVHHVTPRVDAGAPVLRLRAALEPDDSFYTMKARLVAALASALAERMQHERSRADAPDARAEASPPSASRAPDAPPPVGDGERREGHLVRFHDRRIRDDLRERFRALLGGRPPRQALLVERFGEE
ncbi:MAG TPA: formyltransferase family protein [Gemmatimonadaceae bacterium]|nr:formyltransferase family protein [Gemmatimonadaceae bacterium]